MVRSNWFFIAGILALLLLILLGLVVSYA